MVKVSDYIIERIKVRYGVEIVFLVSGGGAMHLNDSIGQKVPYLCNHHEQASAFAAEGYARVYQKLAVVNITSGPAGLNCLNGVLGQWTDSVPVLYISGQVKYTTTIASCKDIPLRQLGDQEADIIASVKHITKYAAMVTEPKSIKYHLDRAIYLATHGRFGPVWLDIPLNVQAAMVDENELIEYDENEDRLELPNIDEELNSVLELLKEAKRPLIVAGHGIRLSGGKEEFLKLVEKLEIPVVTTINGFDLISGDNPLFVGRIGSVGNRPGNFALQNADLVITIGSRNNIRHVSYNWDSFAKNAKLVVVDIDRAELDKPTIGPRTFIKIQADAKDFINLLLAKAKVGNIYKWRKWCQNIVLKYPVLEESIRSPHAPIEPYWFFYHLIRDCYSNKEISISSVGSSWYIPFVVGSVKNGQRFIRNDGSASMGYSLPASIGACIANNKQRVICLEGDGSIMMNIQELQTIKHYNLPIKIFVLNNSGYISIQQTQRNFFKRFTASTKDSGVSMPDFVKVAEAFGIPAFRLDNKEIAIKKAKEIISLDGPALIEVVLTTGYSYAPKLSARTLEDGSIVSPTLEDMSPFLDREELLSNMVKDEEW